MIDFVLGLYFASLAVRGWLRGFVKELMDLAGLVIGMIAGVRFSAGAGRFFESWSGLGSGTSRVLGGVAIFFAVGLVASVSAHYLGKVMRRPGLNLSNRLAGLGLAFGWGWVLATVIISVATVAPLPDDWKAGLEESTLVGALVDDAQPVQVAIQRFAGDRTLQSALNLDRLIGDRQIILDPDETYEIEVASDDEIVRDREAERVIFDLVNLGRIDSGVDALSWHDVLADVAAAYAREMALGGFFGHELPDGLTAADRVVAAGVPYRVVGENLALSVTAEMAHEGLMASEGHRANILRDEFRNVGIGVVDTPNGLIIVQLFHG